MREIRRERQYQRNMCFILFILGTPFTRERADIYSEQNATPPTCTSSITSQASGEKMGRYFGRYYGEILYDIMGDIKWDIMGDI